MELTDMLVYIACLAIVALIVWLKVCVLDQARKGGG